jgi:hypothetical protein
MTGRIKIVTSKNLKKASMKKKQRLLQITRDTAEGVGKEQHW